MSPCTRLSGNPRKSEREDPNKRSRKSATKTTTKRSSDRGPHLRNHIHPIQIHRNPIQIVKKRRMLKRNLLLKKKEFRRSHLLEKQPKAILLLMVAKITSACNWIASRTSQKARCVWFDEKVTCRSTTSYLDAQRLRLINSIYWLTSRIYF